MATKPVLLLADSQLLFWQKGAERFLRALFTGLEQGKAAYIGAANDDRPEFYQIFCSAFEIFPNLKLRHIKKDFKEEDRQFLNQADLILLSGGDVLKGWEILDKSGMKNVVLERYYNGAYLVGISAGAIHLGLAFADQQSRVTPLLKCLPFVVDVHQDYNNWSRLKQTLRLLNNPYVYGIGIPFGSGIIYHADHSLEAVHKAAYLFEQKGGSIKGQLLLPDDFQINVKV